MDMLIGVERPCPYCGEINELLVDSSVPRQRYTEDCAVCCQPMVITLAVHDPDGDEEPEVSLRREAD